MPPEEFETDQEYEAFKAAWKAHKASQAETLTMDDIANMSEADINTNWRQVSKVLERGDVHGNEDQ